MAGGWWWKGKEERRRRRTMLYYVGILDGRYQAAMFHLHGTLSNPPRFRILKSGSILRLRSRRLLLSRVQASAVPT